MGLSEDRLPTHSAVIAACLALITGALLPSQVVSTNSEPFAEGRLWRVAKPDVADSYVFGTIHIPDPRLAVIPRPVGDAIARSRSLLTEVTLQPVTPAQRSELEEMADGSRLEELIGVEAFLRLRAALNSRALPDDAAERLRPWAAMMKVANLQHRSSAGSLDEQLVGMAYTRGMRVISLESIDEQAAAFDAIPLDSQVALLKHALINQDALAATIEPTVDAWLRGDLATLAKAADRIGERFPGMTLHYAKLAKHIIHDRTDVFHHRLFMHMRAGGAFVAVGAAHLYGKRGLLGLLEEQGYRVSLVW